MSKALSEKAEEKNLNDCDDTSSSQNTFSSLPHEQEQSAKTSISVGSFPQAHVSTSSDDMPVPQSYLTDDKVDINITDLHQDLKKSVHSVQAVQNLDGDIVDQVSATSSSSESNIRNIDGIIEPIQVEDSQSSASLNILDSPNISEKSASRAPHTSASSPAVPLTSWLGGTSHNEYKASPQATPSIESFASVSEFDASPDLKSTQAPSANASSSVSVKLLLEIDDSGYGGGPCSAGATAVLDFMAEVLSDFIIEQMKAAQVIEGVLEMVPLYVDVECVLVFQGLFLSRLMNFVERRLLRDDEEDEKKLDKSRWSSNLDALCWMIVDRVYMGAFPQPAGVLKTLEFMLSMLQLANKDGRIEEAAPAGKGLLFTRGSKQLDAYIHSLLKNTNRMILYCFLPTFLATIGEDDILLCLGLLIEPRKRLSPNASEDDSGIDICTVLQLLVAHRRIIFCPSNLDTDLNCCLCVNLVFLLHDQRRNVQNVAVDIVKYQMHQDHPHVFLWPTLLLIQTPH